MKSLDFMEGTSGNHKKNLKNTPYTLHTTKKSLFSVAEIEFTKGDVRFLTPFLHTKGGLISEFCTQDQVSKKSQILSEHFLFWWRVFRGVIWHIFLDLSQSGKLSDIKPPLENPFPSLLYSSYCNLHVSTYVLSPLFESSIWLVLSDSRF